MVLNDSEPLSSRRTVVWTISNLARSKPPPSEDALREVISIVHDVLKPELPGDIAPHALWALSFCIEAADSIRDYVLDQYPMLLPVVVSRIGSPRLYLQTPSLRMTGSFAAGTSRTPTRWLAPAYLATPPHYRRTESVESGKSCTGCSRTSPR
jgi:hypothetical protein